MAPVKGTQSYTQLLDRLSFTPQVATTIAERFGAGLFPVQSPLLGKSWLFSFPPLSNMLKFSGCSRLNRGRNMDRRMVGVSCSHSLLELMPTLRSAVKITTRVSYRTRRIMHMSTVGRAFSNRHELNYIYKRPSIRRGNKNNLVAAMCVRDADAQCVCNSH